MGSPGRSTKLAAVLLSSLYKADGQLRLRLPTWVSDAPIDVEVRLVLHIVTIEALDGNLLKVELVREKTRNLDKACPHLLEGRIGAQSQLDRYVAQL